MPIKYVPFIPEPIEGQAVLANFNRILKYKGADEVSTTLQRGMPLYEMEKVETVGENAEGNMVIRGECVSACAYLKEKGIQVDLVYIDPPFASGADYAKKVYIRRNPKVAEAIAQAEQELDIDELKAFEEKMYGDVWDKEKYLNWMYENLMAIKSIMSETASIYVHLDYHIGHYVKVLMDEVFGDSRFINEVIYKRGNNKKSNNMYAWEHDTILYYSKSDEYVYNPQFKEYTQEYLDKYYGNIDENGRRYQVQGMYGKGAGPAMRFGDRVIAPPSGLHWRWDQERINKAMKDGIIIFPKDGDGMPRFKDYLDDKLGVPIRTIWNDITEVNSQAEERADYATQKPESLLERVLKVSSNERMIVADFFGGSGVTAAVANKLGRRFIHCDIGINSIQTSRDRLVADGAQFDILEIKDGVQLYRNPVQTMDKIKALIPGLKNEDSLDSFWEGAISDSKLGTVPVYVPNLMDSASKLLDKVTMNRIIHQAIPELDSSIQKVIVYYVDITSQDEIRRFIEDDDSTTVEIELRDLKTVLDDVIVEDYVTFHTEENTDSLFGGFTITIDSFVSDRVNSKILEFNSKALSLSAKKPIKMIEISEEGLELIEFLSVDCTTDEGKWHSDSEIKIDKNGYVICNGTKTKEFWDGTISCDQKPLRLKIRNICGDETIWTV